MDTDILRRCYAAFNTRDLEGALAVMHPDVHWPNGWEGGWVEGREGVRQYWQRQWAAIDSSAEPRHFRMEPDGRIAVSVHQVVRDLKGEVLVDEMVEHVYRVQDGLVRQMDIRRQPAWESNAPDWVAPRQSVQRTLRMYSRRRH